MAIPILRKQKKAYQGLRIWTETHDLLKSLAEKYEIPMTRFLHSVVVKLAESNGIEKTKKGDV